MNIWQYHYQAIKNLLIDKITKKKKKKKEEEEEKKKASKWHRRMLNSILSTFIPNAKNSTWKV